MSNCGSFTDLQIPGIASFDFTCSHSFHTDYLCELAGDDNLASQQEQQRISSKSILMPVLSSSTASFPVPTVVCPAGHFTHSFMACDPANKCWQHRNSYVENKAPDILCRAPLTSLPAMMACDSGVQHVPYSLVCDHQQQCDDGSDEDFCVFPACSKGKPLKCVLSAQVWRYTHTCIHKTQTERHSDRQTERHACMHPSIHLSIHPSIHPSIQ